MIYKIYPWACWIGGGISYFGTYVLFHLITSSLWWAMLAFWFVGIVAGILCGCVVLSVWPRARYVNSAEVDGTGYVHSDGNWIMGFTIFVLLVSFNMMGVEG